jgi:hypothetical protein
MVSVAMDHDSIQRGKDLPESLRPWPQPARVENRHRHESTKRFGKTKDGREILRAGAALVLMRPAEKNGIECQRRSHKQRARTARAMKFVTAYGDEVRMERMDACDGLLAKPLHGIGVKEHTSFATEVADVRDGLQRAGLVVRCHHRDKNGVGSEGVEDILWRDAPRRIDGQECQSETFTASQIVEALENGVMFDGRADEVASLMAACPSGTKDGEIVGLRATTGENEFAGSTLECAGDALPRLIEEEASAAAELMNAGGVPPRGIECLNDNVADPRIQGRRCVVIEVNRA